MTITIKNRYTGETIRTVDAETLAGADLRGADLSGARLYGAHLRGARLRGAHLRGADLSGARLYGAHLRGADLSGARLYGADLRGARLYGAHLRGADLSGARLYGADLTGVAMSLGIEVDPALPARILAQIEAHPETHDQATWHSSCGTKHCVAGWACALSGEAGKALDEKLGTATAATLLLWRPGVTLPSFAESATSEETLSALREMVRSAGEGK